MYLINLIGWSGSGKGYLAEKIIETFGADRVDTIPYDMYYYPDAEFPKHLYVEFEWKNSKILIPRKRSRQICSSNI
jgi:uridine kinase